MNTREELKKIWKERGYNYRRIDLMGEAQVAAIYIKERGRKIPPPIKIETPSKRPDWWSESEWEAFSFEEN